jgi:3D (Asp-Asp-Asp) domain-containing protein
MLGIFAFAIIELLLIIGIAYVFTHQGFLIEWEDRMLRKITEAVTHLLSHRKKFKDTKVYNYRHYFLTILATILLVGSMCVISAGGESKEEKLSTTAQEWHYCTTAPATTEETTTESTTVTTSTISTTAAPETIKTTTTKPSTTKTTTRTTANTTKVEKTSQVATQGKLIGRFKITVYCACAKCCGKYAYNRPVDSNGNVIVKGASGRVLIPHYSIATDPRVIPSGKEVVINGKTYRADDTGGAVKGNVIDIYAGTNHQEAMNYAYAMESQYANVYWK